MVGDTRQNIPGWLHIPLVLFHWVGMATISVLLCMAGWVILPFSLLFDRGSRKLMHGIAIAWARLTMAFNPFWRLKVVGRENIERGRHYVIISNHQSILDILVVLCGLPLNFKFLSKKEVFRIPFIGWHMFLTRYISLDRGSQESGRRALADSARWLERKVSVVFFPEGTRTLDGNIRTFKPGGFKLAQDAQVSILPLVIEGTGDALPKKTWIMKQRHDFILSIGKPVMSSPEEPLQDLVGRVRNEMIARLQAIRRAKALP